MSRTSPEPARFALRGLTEPGPAQNSLIFRHEGTKKPQKVLGSKKTLAEGKGPSWKKSLIPFESGLEPEDVYASGIVGYTSMISAGIAVSMLNRIRSPLVASGSAG